MATTISAPLAGKVAIVTGGSKGIGAAIAKTLVEHGITHISVTYTTKPDGAEATLKEIKAISPNTKTTAIRADLLSETFASDVVDGTLKNLETDHIDIVIANAALVKPATPEESNTKPNFDSQLGANTWKQYDLAKTAVEHMPPGGRIIFISSIMSKFPMGETNMMYGAAKAALDSISRNLAVAWGVTRGVTVNTISVGATRTDAWRGAAKSLGLGEESFEKMTADFSNLKRIGEVQDVADIVAFVASPAARWINGNQIPANGGLLSMAQ